MTKQEYILLSQSLFMNAATQCMERNWEWEFCKIHMRRETKNIVSFLQKRNIELIDYFSRMHIKSSEELTLMSAHAELLITLSQINNSEQDVRPTLIPYLNAIYDRYNSKINLDALCSNDLIKYGFNLWSEDIEDKSALMLLPIYMIYLLPKNLTVKNIYGDTTTLDKCNKDTCDNTLFYGISIHI